MIAKTMEELEAEIQLCMRRAMENTIGTIKASGDDIMADFYNSPEPKEYRRTGKFGRSLRKKDVSGSGNDLETTLYRDTNYTYPKGFRNGSPYGSVPAQDVHEWAEEGSHRIKGKPGTWARTLDMIEREIDINFGEYFKK